jgi:hypothetical protein
VPTLHIRLSAFEHASFIELLLLVQVARKIGIPGLYLHEAVEDESVEGTGNLIWTSGIRLSQHLVKNRGNELKGARVLDLGSGTGVCLGGEGVIWHRGVWCC